MRLKRLLVIFVLAAAAGISAAGWWLFAGLPSAEISAERLWQPSVRITDRNGRLLYEALPPDGGRHSALPIDQIPLTARLATVATEDSSFFTNPGVDLAGVLRSAWINLSGGDTLAGGSTITQQVARNLLMSEEERSERSLRRKLREAMLAWQLTRRYSKDEILALYLNQTNYGGLSYGIEAAAQTYFGKPASQLTLAESALLAGLPQAPALYDPFTDPQAAVRRRETVLELMEKAGFISADERQMADTEPLRLSESPYPLNAPHFALMALAQLDGLLTPAQIRAAGGVTARTTLDLDAQQAAERAVTQQLKRLEEKGQSRLGFNVNDAAVVSLDPRTGEILVMVGSAGYENKAIDGAINMALVPRQPGSALKPYIYAAAFDPTRTHPWNAATMILDVTHHFVTHDGKPYTPKNYDGLEHGPVLARQALASSLNIPAVLALDNVGLPALFELAGKAGMDSFGSPDHYDLSVALGGGEVRLIDLTAGYAALANGGLRVEPFAIFDVTGADGSSLYRHDPAPARQIMDERVAWLITDILSDDAARSIGFQAHSALNIGRPAAVKTGTTTNFHDNWTVGYTPSLVTGVWVGNASHEAMREVNGLTGAAPIWHQVMREMLAGSEPEAFVRPAGLKQVEICSLSGLLPTEACPYRRTEWFIDGTEPTAPDFLYQVVKVDALTGREAGPATPPGRIKQVTALNLPAPAHPWARAHGLILTADLAQGQPAGAAMKAGSSLEAGQGFTLVSPAPRVAYLLAGSLPADSQKIPVEAAGPLDLTQVTLFIDGSALQTFTQPPYRAFWQLEAGAHSAWATGFTADGEEITTQTVQFQVDSSIPK